jgi:hypothetical protein
MVLQISEFNTIFTSVFHRILDFKSGVEFLFRPLFYFIELLYYPTRYISPENCCFLANCLPYLLAPLFERAGIYHNKILLTFINRGIALLPSDLWCGDKLCAITSLLFSGALVRRLQALGPG